MEPVSVVIPAYNQLEYCRQCITSIQAGTRHPYRLILADNGSTDGVSEYFDTLPGAEVIHLEENKGFAGGVNAGLERASGHVVVLNSDTLTPRNWLTRLVAALEQSDGVGMLGPRTSYASGPQQIDGLEFKTLDEVNEYADALHEEHGTTVTDTQRLVGFCLLIRQETLAKVGNFDESFGIGNYEDDDYCRRVRAQGYRLGIAQGAFIYHYGNRTFLGMGVTGPEWDGLLERNREKFFAKWDIKPQRRADAVQESQELNAAARAALDKGDVSEALKLLRDALAACPVLEVNYNDLGAVLWDLGQQEAAFEQFKRALQLNPSYQEARDNLQAAAEALGRQDEANTLLEPRETT